MKAIEIKMVDYQPMTKGEAKEQGYFKSNDDQDLVSKEKGYVITHPDGYMSWSPKDVFDKAYFSLFDENGDSITLADIEDLIIDKYSVKVGTKNTNTTLVCKTGFEIHGQSGCVKKEDFDIIIGEKRAEPRAIDQLYFAMGFVLQWAKYGLNAVEKDNTPDHIKRVIKEHNELSVKTKALEDFIDNNKIFLSLKDEEKRRYA